MILGKISALGRICSPVMRYRTGECNRVIALVDVADPLCYCKVVC